MKYKDFEEYLMYKHSEQNPEVLDDDLPDDYERWLEEIGVDGVISYADSYALHIMDEVIKIVEKPLKVD